MEKRYEELSMSSRPNLLDEAAVAHGRHGHSHVAPRVTRPGTVARLPINFLSVFAEQFDDLT